MKRVIKVRKLRNCIISIFCIGLLSSQALAFATASIDTISDNKLKNDSSTILSKTNSHIVDVSYQKQLSS